jgi:hypothetical protein
MDVQTRRWSHATNLAVLQRHEGRLDWIRKTTFTAPRLYFDQEGDGDPTGFVELLVTLFVEQPGFPPIMGVACEVEVEAADVAKELLHTVWYYNANEFYADFAGEVPSPATKLHVGEVCEEPPAWVWPPDEEADE